MQDINFQKKDFDWQQFIGKPFHKSYSKSKKMAYNKFTTLKEAVEKLNLKVENVKSIVDEEHAFLPSDFLKMALERGTSLALKIDTEKARSEMIVSPILVELQEIKKGSISLFSGITFNVDVRRGLSGRCDFIISAEAKNRFLTAPVLTVVEAKNDNVNAGLGQCVAEMVAAQLFNQKEGKNIHIIYGTVTNGINWLFLKLIDNTVYIEELERVYDFSKNLDELIGLLMTLTDPQN